MTFWRQKFGHKLLAEITKAAMVVLRHALKETQPLLLFKGGQITDDDIEDLKIDLIAAKRLAIDENDRILV